jgi:hypothetical protein
MGVDLHRIGLGISSGWSHNGYGTIVSFPTGASFPAYGTYNSTLTGVDYLAGTSYVIQTVTYYEQTADYIVKNDGAGGTYTDYATASNIQYKTGSFLQTTTETHDGAYVTLPYGLGSYPTASYAGYDYNWNGYGGYVAYDYYLNYTYSGQIGPNDYINSSMSSGYYYVNIGGSNIPNGKYTYYNVTGISMYSANDNFGNYYSYGSTTGAYDGMGNPYYWDGNGGYYS